MRMKKVITAGVLSIITSLAIGTVIYNADKHFVKEQAGGTDYTITLDSSNAYTSGTTQQIEINNGGWEVQFKYTSCSASSGNHAAIADGGTITNVDHILSVNKINVSYTGGTLKYATSLDATEWSSYTTLSQGSNDVTGNPYYIRLQATGAVTLTSATYTYSCVETTAQESFSKVTSIGDVTTGSYLIVCSSQNVAFDGSLATLDATDNYVAVTITNNEIEATSALKNSIFNITKSGNNYAIQSASGKYINRSADSNGLDTSNSATNNTITISSGNATITGSGNAVLRYNKNADQKRFRYFKTSSYSSQQTIQLFKLSGVQEKEVITGFTAVDNNAETYDTKSVYNTANGLVVSAKYSTGEYKPLASGYTYKVYNSSDVEIDTSEAFPAAGNYYVLVSYSTYPDVRINFTVAEAPANFTLVTNANQLSAGDQIVIANSSKGKVAGSLDSQILGSVTATFSNNKDEIIDLPNDANIFTLGGTSDAWTLNNGHGALGATAVKKLAYDDGTTTWSISIAGGDATIQNATSGYGRFLYNVSSPRFTTYISDPTDTMLMPQIYKLPGEPVYPTSISLSGSHEVEVGKKTSLSVSYIPENTNKKTVVWDTEDSSVAIVSNKGVVTGVAEGTTNITAKAVTESGYTPLVKWNITINPAQIDDYTILIYMCGSDLESDDGAASGDIEEMLTVNLPDSVNIIIETGGAKTWHNYGINSSYNEIYSIEDQSLVRLDQLTKASMGDEETFESFLEWGLETYPAKQTALIMWNHGGAMSGCCYDEFAKDYLTPKELRSGLETAFDHAGITEKLAWIGYDCCLMQVADIATTNADYFDYMIASQESEWGDGWAYDDWLPTLAANTEVTPDVLLPVICDTFVDFYDTAYQSEGYGPEDNFQALSVLDLSKADDFVTAFNNYATNLGINSTSKFDKIVTAYESSLRFGYDNDYGYTFGVADMNDFLKNMKTQFGGVSQTALEAAIDDLIIYNQYGDYYSSTKPCGLCVLVVWAGEYYWGYESDYPLEATKLDVWRNLNINYSDAVYNGD